MRRMLHTAETLLEWITRDCGSPCRCTVARADEPHTRADTRLRRSDSEETVRDCCRGVRLGSPHYRLCHGGSRTNSSVPGTVQAEDFDQGAADVAYSDTTPGNAGGAYRSTNVDIEATTDTGGGYNLAWVAAGEWLRYTVNVAAAGTYNLEVRVAARGAGGIFHIEINGVDRTGPIGIPETGGWQQWTSVVKNGLNLTAGTQVWRVVMDQAGEFAVGNINFLRVVSATPSPAPAPDPAPSPAPTAPRPLPIGPRPTSFFIRPM